MAEGDVEFFDAGGVDDMLVVDVRGRRYEITVRDIEPSMLATLNVLMTTSPPAIEEPDEHPGVSRAERFERWRREHPGEKVQPVIRLSKDPERHS